MRSATSQYGSGHERARALRPAAPSVSRTPSRLYMNTAASTTHSTTAFDDSSDSKISALSSVSPTSSIRNLTMRSLSSHGSSESVKSNSDSSSTIDPDRRITTATTSRHRQRPPQSPSKATGASSTATRKPATFTKVSFNDSQTEELQHIKSSVERLRTQRAHVEQLRQQNTRLESRLTEQSNENDKLQLQLASFKGVEQENVGLLQSFQLLEERIRTLEATCSGHKDDARVANERCASMEKAHDMLQLHVDELLVERDHLTIQLTNVHSSYGNKIEQLQSNHEKALKLNQRAQSDGQRRLEELQRSQHEVELKFQHEITQLQKENQTLVRESRAMEQHVQQLLATTVRQTTVIEDCDRALSEIKSRHEKSKASYKDQLQLNAQLQHQIKQLEIQLATSGQRFDSERTQLERKSRDLEANVQKLTDKHDMYAIALREQEAHCEKIQQELLVRDRARFHVDVVAKELRQQEKTLRSELSALQIALTDMTDERSILQEQLRTAHGQLEKERKDRSRWATARLKLLAEFCDEESKLNSALHQYSPLDRNRHHGHPEDGDGEDEDGDGEDQDESAVDVRSEWGGESSNNGEDGDSVVTAVLAAGLKMDALEQYHLHGSNQVAPRSGGLHRKRSTNSSPHIVFG